MLPAARFWPPADQSKGLRRKTCFVGSSSRSQGALPSVHWAIPTEAFALKVGWHGWLSWGVGVGGFHGGAMGFGEAPWGSPHWGRTSWPAFCGRLEPRLGSEPWLGLAQSSVGLGGIRARRLVG